MVSQQYSDIYDRYLENTFGINDYQRDLEHNRLKMSTEMVIEQRSEVIDGKETMVWHLIDSWLTARDVTLCYGGMVSIQTEQGVVKPGTFDVFAYIPNKDMIATEQAIRKAWNAQDYEEVYRLFHEAYTFIPITHNEWLKLQENGQL